jgi:Fe2+ or Zn2+ uptake regulation protein
LKKKPKRKEQIVEETIEKEVKINSRMTRQKACLYRIVENASRPLTIEEIFEMARTEIQGIGLRTIYRNVDGLIADFKIARVDYPGQPMRYETVTGSERPHVVCTKCNKVFWINQPLPELKIENENFDIIGRELILYGNCKKINCSEKDN